MADNNPGRISRWCLPSLTHWLWLVLFAVLLTAQWRTALVSADGDPCWHWRLGERMLETRQIVRADEFSHTCYGQPFLTKEWLAEIALAVGGQLGGLYGVAVVGALLIATTFALLHRQLRRDGIDVVTSVLVVLFAAQAATTHWIARPHLFTMLFAVLWNGVLRNGTHPVPLSRNTPPEEGSPAVIPSSGGVDPEQARCPAGASRGPGWVSLVLPLALLTLFWVNLHGGFLVGFILLGIYWLGSLIDWLRTREQGCRQRLLELTVAGAVCAAVSLLNPNGLTLHLHNLRFLGNEFFTGWLVEYQSANFKSPAAFGFLCWLALLFVTLAVVRPRISVTDGLLLVVWVYFGLYAGRNIPLLALVTAPIIARAWSDALTTPGAGPTGGFWAGLRARLATLAARLSARDAALRGWPVAAVLALLLALAWPHPTAMPADKWPVAAVEYVRQHPGQFQGNVFNQYSWGGYMIRYLPEHKVFVDGRADFYGEGPVREFDDTTALRPNWREALDRHRVTWTLMPSEHRLNLALALLPDWERVYHDDVATIYLRQSGK